MYYVKSLYNPNKHSLIPDDYPWYISASSCPNGIEITEEDYNTLVSSFDLSAYFAAVNPTQSQIEEQLILKSAAYMGAGKTIADELEKKIWARNEYLASTGNQISAQQLSDLLTLSVAVDRALRTGALETTKYMIVGLKAIFPAYEDIGDWIVNSVDNFLLTQQR